MAISIGRVLALFGLASCGASYAQLDLLTVREAESLVVAAPAVAEAWRRGECPALSASYLGPYTLLVQARGACPNQDTESTLISNYFVDRANGAVTEGERKRISTPEIDQMRARMLMAARGRVLSTEETRCLAVVAFGDQTDIQEQRAQISITPTGRAQGPEFQFVVSKLAPKQRARTGGLFTVDTTTAHVRNDQAGVDIFSPELGFLASRMLALRAPPLLSAEDVVKIALQLPVIAALLADACFEAESDGTGAAEEAYVAIASTCSSRASPPGPLVSVNTRTGVATDPKTHKMLSTPESERTARRLLDNIQQQLVQVKGDINAKCHVYQSQPSSP
jgi:hypothetical protein